MNLYFFLDKTSTFQHQIEAKQKELAPWMEKVNKLQAELGVSESEYDMLMKRISAGEVKLKDAQQAVSELMILKKEKVGHFYFSLVGFSMPRCANAFDYEINVVLLFF